MRRLQDGLPELNAPRHRVGPSRTSRWASVLAARSLLVRSARLHEFETKGSFLPAEFGYSLPLDQNAAE